MTLKVTNSQYGQLS